MNLLKTYYRCMFSVFLFAGLIACKKSFLEEKPNTNITSPQSLADYQKMLDFFRLNCTSALGQLSCDEYTIPSDEDWAARTPTERNAYIWAADLFGGQLQRNDWNYPYESVFYANSILNGIEDLAEEENTNEYKNIKGQALFVRAFAFFDLAKNFAPPYDEMTADDELGIPLKLSPNVDEIVQRASLRQTYRQIVDDLNEATQLLPANVPTLRNRASRPAAYGLFARLYLSMRKYDLAEAYADSCLGLYNKLIDYNKLNSNALSPFIQRDDECIFWSRYGMSYPNTSYNTNANIQVSEELLNSYDAGDLRRSIFFITNVNNNLVKVRRGYTGPYNFPFSGIATDEILLIKAECAARRADIQTASVALNTLLVKRFTPESFKPSSIINAEEGLQLILLERRKELVWRAGLRWDDLRRLNKEGANITLTRMINGERFQLEPNSPRYTFPIPDDEMMLSGLVQNKR